ncbi:MFS transporter [Cohnella sp.]|uniref:MFS transporter n=1 Tax=Cohnella sp. TaxID=1883426 RepID=UPI003561D2EA
MSVVNRLRVFNFLYFAMFALFLSFLPVYAAKVGISGTHIGFVLGVGSFVSIVSQPLWGMVSDRTKTIKNGRRLGIRRIRRSRAVSGNGGHGAARTAARRLSG